MKLLLLIFFCVTSCAQVPLTEAQIEEMQQQLADEIENKELQNDTD